VLPPPALPCLVVLASFPAPRRAALLCSWWCSLQLWLARAAHLREHMVRIVRGEEELERERLYIRGARGWRGSTTERRRGGGGGTWRRRRGCCWPSRAPQPCTGTCAGRAWTAPRSASSACARSAPGCCRSSSGSPSTTSTRSPYSSPHST
jgi:hypothetical protein